MTASRSTVLTELDHRLLEVLHAHRVLTTPQLIVATRAPERTVDYRLSRLLRHRLVARTRPYRDRGSAPYHWWLTLPGCRLVGQATKPLRAPANPTFLAHTVAVAGMSLALREAAGLELLDWVRDEQAWEEWSSLGRRGKVTPDGCARLAVTVDSERDVVDLFVEVDLGTMAHHRLRGKLWRYLRYAEAETWVRRHPGCPPLVVLTTSEARADRFLRAVRAMRTKDRPYAYYDNKPREELIVAACGLVDDPARAVGQPVWRTAPDAPPVALTRVLSAAVRQHRPRTDWEAEQAAHAAKRAPHEAVHNLAYDTDRLALSVGDDGAAEGLRVLLNSRHSRWRSGDEVRTRWIDDRAPLILALRDWWDAQRARRRPDRADDDVVVPLPASALDALRQLAAEGCEAQARRLLGSYEVQRLRDPRLVPLALRLAAGGPVDDHDLEGVEGWPQDGAKAVIEGVGNVYRTGRAAAVEAKKATMRRRERRRASDQELGAAYDVEHLLACGRCAVPNGRRSDRCPICGGSLVPYPDRPRLPSIEAALRAVAVRLSKQRSSPPDGIHEPKPIALALSEARAQQEER